MGIVLGANSYGKAGNHLFKVVRATDRHEVRDYRVDVALTGDYDAVHTHGDNTGAMATDTMRNTVYAVAKQHDFDSPERYGLQLVDYLLTQPRVRVARVSVVEQRWNRIVVDGRPHDHAFTKAAGGKHTAVVTGEGDRRAVSAGLDDLHVLKTTNSGWSNFLEGGYRTLKDTDDRILATSITASWDYREPSGDFGAWWDGVHEQIGRTFTDHFSPSVQHTIWRMGQAILERFEQIERISFTLPNKHHLLYDLAPFGMDNDREIYWVTVEPYGRIQATVERD
ncbi:MAG TPA: urate oxidase [Actinomycetes bacterium]|nr:urate oxidase [Actinomycetes bacterium]